VSYARGSKSFQISFDIGLFVLSPENDGCWGLRGVRISPIAGREANAGGENDGFTTGAEMPLIGGWIWFNWLDGVMEDVVSGGCWLAFAKTSDNETL